MRAMRPSGSYRIVSSRGGSVTAASSRTDAEAEY
jgi:hypothetical protein